MSELIEHNEMIIIIIQAVFLIISEIMPFLKNEKNGIIDGLVKIYRSECCESPEEVPLNVYGVEDAQNSLDSNCGTI
tara:strand:+ start:465 stop:695 length:231 start_codon:yes stop_codon:yes gene_type:complete